MMRRRICLFVALFVFAVPLFAHDTVTLVVVDVEKNRAYVPVGTVLPRGKTARASVTRLPMNGVTLELPRFGERSFTATARAQALRHRPPLVFEYAPEEMFTEARARYEAFQARQQSSPNAQSHLGGCQYWYWTLSGTGVYGTYYSEFIEMMCGESWEHGYAWRTYGATAAAADDGYVFVDDLFGNYECDDSGYGYRVRSCEAESYQLYAARHVNDIVVAGHTALIEWLEGYQPNYVWFNIQITWEVWHY